MKHKTDRKIIKAREEQRLDTEMKNLQVEEIKDEVAVAQEVKKLEEVAPSRAREQNFESDYKRYIKSKENADALEAVRETIYEHYGFVGKYEDPVTGNYERSPIDRSDIARADLNELTKLEDSNKVTLTEKGRYFLKRHFTLNDND